MIEVADATLERDRNVKLRSYARAGIGCYWIVNLVDRQIEAYTDPESSATPPRFRRSQQFRLEDSVPLVLDGAFMAAIPVSQVLPPVTL